MKRKIFIGIVIIGVMISMAAIFVIPRISTKEKTKEIKLETYSKDNDDVHYKYLHKIALTNGKSFLSTYQLINNADTKDNQSKAETSGVSVELTLYNTEEQTIGQVLENEYKNRYDSLTSQADIQNLKVYDVVKGDGCYIQQIDYSHSDGSNIYPCAMYIKCDEVSSGSFLDTVVTMDNTKADENTAAILQEVLLATGIELNN